MDAMELSIHILVNEWEFLSRQTLSLSLSAVLTCFFLLSLWGLEKAPKHDGQRGREETREDILDFWYGGDGHVEVEGKYILGFGVANPEGITTTYLYLEELGVEIRTCNTKLSELITRISNSS